MNNEQQQINENYLKTKMELLIHELEQFISMRGKYMHHDDRTEIKNILLKHKRTLDTYGTNMNSGFVPLNLDREPTK
jgi:hypothetical protein